MPDIWTLLLRRDQQARNREHSRDGHTDCARITLDGRTVSHARTAYSSNAPHMERMERTFWEHLRHALTSPDTFTFDGAGGRMQAAAWIEHHRVRLGLDSMVGLWAFHAAGDGPSIDTFRVEASA